MTNFIQSKMVNLNDTKIQKKIEHLFHLSQKIHWLYFFMYGTQMKGNKFFRT